MSIARKRSKLDWLVGRWRASEGQISVSFFIDRGPNGLRVQAVDESDGEKLVVSKVKWDGKALSFETLTPSNKWRTRNSLRVISSTKAIQELTYWEPWEKTSPEAS
jgi:hypothetical protein